jgi:hypothetical protein
VNARVVAEHAQPALGLNLAKLSASDTAALG